MVICNFIEDLSYNLNIYGDFIDKNHKACFWVL